MFIPPDSNLCIGDVSVINPAAGTYRDAAARKAGAAAEVRDRQKELAYRAHDPDAYDFVPLTHESFGRLGEPAMRYLNKLADIAVRCGDVSRSAFVTMALRRLSVAMCRGNALIFRLGMQTLTGTAGSAPMAGRKRPTAHAH